jgi:hypothetical protein
MLSKPTTLLGVEDLEVPVVPLTLEKEEG